MTPIAVNEEMKKFVLEEIRCHIPSFNGEYWGVLFTDDQNNSYHRIYVNGWMKGGATGQASFLVLLHDDLTIHSIAHLEFDVKWEKM